MASLVDLVGSAVIFAGGSPVTGVSLDITVSYLGAAGANVRYEYMSSRRSHIYLPWG